MNTLLVDITQKCNLKCKHCYNSRYFYSNKDEFNLKKLYRYVIDNDIKHIHVLGGEPLISKNIFNLLNFSEKHKIIISINTNGVCLTNKISIKLERYSCIRQITISVDGHNSNINDSIRGKGVFQKVCHNLLAIKKNRQLTNVSLNIAFVVTPDNILSIAHLATLAEALYIDNILISFLYYQGNAINICKNYEFEKIIDALGRLIFEANKKNKEVIIDAKPIVLDYIKLKSKNNLEFTFNQNTMNCYVFTGFSYMSATNDIFPCSPSSFYGEKFLIKENAFKIHKLMSSEYKFCDIDCFYNNYCKKCPLNIKCTSEQLCVYCINKINSLFSYIKIKKICISNDYKLLRYGENLMYLNIKRNYIRKISSYFYNDFDIEKTIEDNGVNLTYKEKRKYLFNIGFLFLNKYLFIK